MDRHLYDSDPQSGAGNCKMCQRPERDIRHYHRFMKAKDAEVRGSRTKCTCGAELGNGAHS